MSTVGYGSLYPISDYCNIVMLWQSYVNIALLAVITSAVFVNFSRPQYGPSPCLSAAQLVTDGDAGTAHSLGPLHTQL